MNAAELSLLESVYKDLQIAGMNLDFLKSKLHGQQFDSLTRTQTVVGDALMKMQSVLKKKGSKQCLQPKK